MRPRSRMIESVACSRPRRAVAIMAIFGLLVAVIAGAGVSADVVGTTTITIGESNTDAQKQELLQIFNAGPDAKITVISVEDTKRAMEGIFERSIASAYSSTALNCRELGDGLDITTRNITVVTPAVYALALVTAGIGDADLIVAAPNSAPAEGMTALTGIFQVWQDAPCESGNTNPARQRLALEELALTATIGLNLVATGTPDGIERASNTVLETQKDIINDKLTDPDQIEATLAAQEAAQGITIPAAQRQQLLDLFVKLANADIDWSTFSKGWTIEYPSDSRIVMRGEGSAIRDAQASATAKAAARLAAKSATQTAEAMAETATAQAALDMTATAQAAEAMTATAIAQATQTAAAALTATFEARPTSTPIPTATPVPVAVSGTISRTSGDEFFVAAASDEGKPVGYRLQPGGSLKRDGKPATVDQLVEGDLVKLTVVGGGPFATDVEANPAPVSLLSRLVMFLWIIPLALAIPAARWAKSRKPLEPFVLRRVQP